MAMPEAEFHEEFIDRVPGMPRFADDELEVASAGRSIPLRTASAVLVIILGLIGVSVGVALYDPRAGIIVGSALLLGLGLLLGFAG